MNIDEKRDFIQNPQELIKYGIIQRKGPRDNQTDCEADNVLIHIPDAKAKRFQGTWYDDKYIEDMYSWIISFPLSQKGVTINRLLEFQTCFVMDLVK